MQRLRQITITEFEQFCLVHSNANHRFSSPCRPNYGLVFSTEGHISYYHNEKQYRTHPGDALLIPQGVAYRLQGEDAGDFGVINFTINNDVCIKDFLIIPTRTPEWYMHMFGEMKALSLFPQKRLQLMRMMYELLENLSEEQQLRSPPLARVMDYLETHYTDWELTNQVLAEQAHISEVYLRQLFQREMGVSPKQYILTLRLKKAKQMLYEEDCTVTKIAQACGFSSIYHFCRAFHQAMGCSPSEYRQTYRPDLF